MLRAARFAARFEMTIDPAVEAGATAAGSIGEVIAVNVIPRPHEDLAL